MKYLILTVVLLVFTFCVSAQLEDMQRVIGYKEVTNKGRVSISKDHSKLIFKYKDYSHTFNISKKEGQDFCYIEYSDERSGLMDITDRAASVLKNQNIAFFRSGKRVARIDMNNNTLQTVEFHIPHNDDRYYDFQKKSLIDNNVAYFLAEPDDGTKKVDLFQVNFKNEEVKNISSLSFENDDHFDDDHFDVVLESDVIFTFDIIHGIRIYDLKTGDKIREIDCSDILPPIVLKDIDDVLYTRLSLDWDIMNNEPLLDISFSSTDHLWKFDFVYDIHAGIVSETEYEHKDFPKSDLKPIWIGDRFMYYKFTKYPKKRIRVGSKSMYFSSLEFPEDEIYIPFPKYPYFNVSKFSKDYYVNYMEAIYQTKYTRDSIYQANKNSNKLFGNGNHINKEEDAIPGMYSFAESFFFVNKEDSPRRYKHYRKERRIFGEEGKAEMDSLMPILEREYARMKKHNLEILNNRIKNAGGELKIYADINGNQEVHSFEYATKAQGVYGQENQVEITKVDEFGEYEIIFDLQKKEVISTNRKTDF